MTLKQTISLYIVASLSVFGLHAASEIPQSIDSFMPMVEIPAGSFYMGGDGGWSTIDETPIHTVEITTP
ncbi:MAG: formylglycine-generating enzyme family protein, partial [Muribaculaceae bacterium]|nr:formylglycine-generating enzyme family protein [Muribaculaceae bacterium]